MSGDQNSSQEPGVETYFYRASAKDFATIPTSPLAYWVSDAIRKAFANRKISDIGKTRVGLQTGDNARFVRQWYECATKDFGLDCSPQKSTKQNGTKWVPYNKGGQFRRWFGNVDNVVNWENDGEEIYSYARNLYGSPTRTVKNSAYYFLPSVTWSKISSGAPSFRWQPPGAIFDVAGASVFYDSEVFKDFLLGVLNSRVSAEFLKTISPTLNFETTHIAALPVLPNWEVIGEAAKPSCARLIQMSKDDWDAFETSWSFREFPLLRHRNGRPRLIDSYYVLRTRWRETMLEMQRLEQENNRIFIDAYGLQDELKPEVPLREITLTCNPHYRYGGDKSEEELEALLLADTMRELVSYAVGCMLGRYSLDKPGLILANQGETLADYLAKVPQPSFPADDDNVIPVLDGDWFADDITLRFRQFLRVAFGDEHYDENLAFIEQALNVKGKRNYSLRDYFLSEFYAEHVKRYKKRPIYWLFSSPKGSFNALIYMHRYRPDTVSVVLKYLRDYREKLSTEKERQASVSINPATSQGDKTRALKEVDRLAKVLAELEDYERDVLYPLATEQKPIDLDDGVKVNYLKFGAALKKITGLDAKEED